jgi:hypothetical protein
VSLRKRELRREKLVQTCVVEDISRYSVRIQSNFAGFRRMVPPKVRAPSQNCKETHAATTDLHRRKKPQK